MVEGSSGVVLYGEIKVNKKIKIGDVIDQGQKIGKVKTVLKKFKGNPKSMLHIELYKHGEKTAVEAKIEKDLKKLKDPTPYLKESLNKKEKIILGICGSISAYKGFDLARSLVKRGKEVQVILTKGALEFLKPEVFAYLGIKYYLPHDDFKNNLENFKSNVLHIDLAKWADTLVIAPASANTLSKISHGGCDDLLTSVWLSFDKKKKKIIAPAMNTTMLNQKITLKNIKKIRKTDNTSIISPDSGLLACGDIGSGKLPRIKELSQIICSMPKNKIDKKVLITAGATLSPVDTIRYITNPAKGATGLLLAEKYLKEGYFVDLIIGKNSLPDFNTLKNHPRCNVFTVITTDDLLELVKTLSFDIYISTMAVSDLKFNPSSKKLKKKDLKSLDFSLAPDVLKWVIENKKEHQTIVGFAAESSLDEKILKEKIERKPVDLLVANIADGGLLGGKAQGFSSSYGTYKLISFNREESYSLSKKDLANQIFSHILEIKKK